ncbi:hypothetical protein BJ944DRAFT_47707 [Cunninghamella echinulata]|nr:hypothetical protein BJ944DRAFT_47707 [Cunninghamella echinulata]
MNTTTTTISNINKENIGLNVIPVVAKQKALEDQKELESIRQAEEAVRKAMERKQKIERARIARQKALAEAEGQQQQSSGTMNDDNNHNDSMEINRKEDVPQLSPQPSYQSVKKINKVINNINTFISSCLLFIFILITTLFFFIMPINLGAYYHYRYEYQREIGQYNDCTSAIYPSSSTTATASTTLLPTI